MKRFTCFMLMSALVLINNTAHGAAWVRAAKTGVLIIKAGQSTGRDVFIDPFFPDIRISRDTQTRFQEIYNEYGLTEKLTLINKVSQAQWQSGEFALDYNEYEIGVRTRVDDIAYGLLPFGVYGLLQRWFPDIEFHRQKVAALTFGGYYRDSPQYDGVFSEISFGDKVFFKSQAILMEFTYRHSNIERSFRNVLSWSWKERLELRLEYFDQHLLDYRAHGVDYHVNVLLGRDMWLDIAHGRKYEGGAGGIDVINIALNIGF